MASRLNCYGATTGSLDYSHEVPTILRTSDAAIPGEVVGIYGEGLDDERLDVFVAPHLLRDLPKTALKIRPVVTDHDGHFVSVELPKTLPAGLFTLWVRTSHGISRPAFVNCPRPKWLSGVVAWPGQYLQLVGMNLAGSEHGGEQDTRIRLRRDGGGSVRLAHVLECNAFQVRFEVPDVEVGSYNVEVSNSAGREWISLPEETITVIAKGEDPLNLGVAWASDFNWKRRFHVSRLPTATVDDNTAIQLAINAAKSSGGGVVVIPPGEYAITGLQLPAGVVLLGAGKTRTLLNYVGTGNAAISSSQDGAFLGLQGIADLTIRVKDGCVLPDVFIVLGQHWGDAAHNESLREATRMFCHRVGVDYDLTMPTKSGHRGLGLIMIGRDRGIIDQCSFRGYYAPPHAIYINSYFWCHDNLIEFSTGVVSTCSSHCILENNHLIGHREYVVGEESNATDMHGFFARDNVFASNNIFEGIGIHEGEAVCVEPPEGWLTYGKVLAATGQEIKVESAVVVDWSKFDPRVSHYGRWHIVIIAGRGLGQYRPIVDAANGTIHISEPWIVLPDSTSRFSIIIPNENVIIYNNKAIDCTKGFWLYGNVIDGVLANNISEDSEGDFANAYHTAQGTYSMIYFVRMTRETVRGVSRRSHHAGIGISTNRTNLSSNYGVHAFGIEITHNDVFGMPGVRPDPTTECPPISGLFSVFYSGNEGNPGCDRVGTIFQENGLHDLAVGISVGRDNCGTTISKNKFDKVAERVEGGTSSNLHSDHDGKGIDNARRD